MSQKTSTKQSANLAVDRRGRESRPNPTAPHAPSGHPSAAPQHPKYPEMSEISYLDEESVAGTVVFRDEDFEGDLFCRASENRCRVLPLTGETW